jgi:hypothetical protein
MSIRRRGERHAFELEVEFTVGEERYLGKTRNLTFGGALIDSDLRLAFGTRIELCFSIPNRKEPVRVGGVVRWSDSTGFGVQFDGLRARDVWSLGFLFVGLSP